MCCKILNRGIATVFPHWYEKPKSKTLHLNFWHPAVQSCQFCMEFFDILFRFYWYSSKNCNVTISTRYERFYPEKCWGWKWCNCCTLQLKTRHVKKFLFEQILHWLFFCKIVLPISPLKLAPKFKICCKKCSNGNFLTCLVFIQPGRAELGGENCHAICWEKHRRTEVILGKLTSQFTRQFSSYLHSLKIVGTWREHFWQK